MRLRVGGEIGQIHRLPRILAACILQQTFQGWCDAQKSASRGEAAFRHVECLRDHPAEFCKCRVAADWQIVFSEPDISPRMCNAQELLEAPGPCLRGDKTYYEASVDQVKGIIGYIQVLEWIHGGEIDIFYSQCFRLSAYTIDHLGITINAYYLHMWIGLCGCDGPFSISTC